MPHRDLRVSLTGLFTGLVLTTGALTFANVSLSASASPPEYTRRAISENEARNPRDVTKHLYPTVKKEPSNNVAPDVEGPLTTCSAVKKTVRKIETVYNAFVPNTYKNTEIREKMDAVIADAMDDYCESTAPAAVQASSAATIEKSNNHCEKYPRHTVRNTQCVLADENGKTYP